MEKKLSTRAQRWGAVRGATKKIAIFLVRVRCALLGGEVRGFILAVPDI